MLMEIYKKYKEEYGDYVLLIKNGNFYLSLNKDTYVMHNMFGYAIREMGSGFKIGFPIKIIQKIKDKFNLLEVNYLIIEDGKIVCSKKFENNKYIDYVTKKNYGLIYHRIDIISNTLKNNIDNDIESLLTSIEGILCMID